LVRSWQQTLGRRDRDSTSLNALAFEGPNWTWQTAICPVEFEGGYAAIAAQVAQADLVVSFGVSVKRERVSLERYALNLRDCDPRGSVQAEGDSVRADNKGRAPIDEPIRKDGPLLIPLRVNGRQIVKRLAEAGMDAEVSVSGGTYVCNDLAYLVAHEMQRRQQSASIFVHVPNHPVRLLAPICETIVKLAAEQVSSG
jgi:pyroglutamyl-peptidase